MNTNERLCRPVRVGELIEPLMKIISHPDRNNLIRDFFAAEDERRRAEVFVATQKARSRKKTRIIPMNNNRKQQIINL